MKNTRQALVLAPLVYVLVQSVGCTSKGRGKGGFDAQTGADAVSCLYESETYLPGETFTVGCGSCLGCRICSCLPGGEVDCVARICPVDSEVSMPGEQDTSPLNACTSADEGCLYNGDKLAVGESGVVGCRTSCGKLTCAEGACTAADAGVSEECLLPSWVKFGPYGGLDGETSTILDTSGTLTQNLGSGSCVSRLPACGTPCAITVATIAKDLADPEVQAAFLDESGIPYGVSRVSADVPDFQISLGDGRSIRVGLPCCRFPNWPCRQPIPKGVQRLVNDLQALLAANTGCR